MSFLEFVRNFFTTFGVFTALIMLIGWAIDDSTRRSAYCGTCKKRSNYTSWLFKYNFWKWWHLITHKECRKEGFTTFNILPMTFDTIKWSIFGLPGEKKSNNEKIWMVILSFCFIILCLISYFLPLLLK